MEIINETHIFLNEALANQQAVLEFLATTAVNLGIANDQQKVYNSLFAREKEGTTGMLEGFAIPHAKDSTIKEASILIVKLNQAVEWESLDGIPTDFIIALFIPDEEASTTHLKLLSQIARMLMRKDFRTELKEINTQERIAQVINSNLKEG